MLNSSGDITAPQQQFQSILTTLLKILLRRMSPSTSSLKLSQSFQDIPCAALLPTVPLAIRCWRLCGSQCNKRTDFCWTQYRPTSQLGLTVLKWIFVLLCFFQLWSPLVLLLWFHLFLISASAIGSIHPFLTTELIYYVPLKNVNWFSTYQYFSVSS